MLRPRVLTCLLALILALPSAAFAQGAGDDQYQDPFGDEPTTQQDGDGGLGDEPPTGGSGDGDGDSGSGEDGSGSGSGSGATGGGDTGSQGTTTTPSEADGLPRTGSDPRPLLLVGAAFLLGGVGLRLRTIDPDDF